MNIIRSAIMSCALILSINSHAHPSPIPMLEQTAQQIMTTLKEHQSTLKDNRQIIYQAIQKNLLPHVDIQGMSRSVLGRQAWTQASPEEKKAFVDAFTRLVIRTYATPLSEYSGETVSFMPIRGSLDGSFVRVNSIISRPNGQRIPLSYHLIAQGEEWKIYDLSIEGISLLQSFKSQFADGLQRGTMRDLIAQIQKNKS